MIASTRGIVVASILLAVATALWSLSTLPAVAGFMSVAFAGGVLAGRWNRERGAIAIVLFMFISPGLAVLAAGPGTVYSYATLAAFAGLLVGGTPWTRWEAQGAWRVAIAWWATGVALTWPVFAMRDLGYTLTRSQAALPVLVAALLQMSAALWLDHLLGTRPRAATARPPAVRYFPAFVASACLTALAAAYQRVFDLTWLSGEPWVSLGRAPGLSGDANPMAVATGVWAPIAAVFAPRTPAGRIAGAAAAAVLVAGTWLSGARTALLLLTIGAVGLVLSLASERRATMRAMVAVAMAVTALMVSLFVLVPRTSGSPVARLVGNLPEARSVPAYAYELLWRRDGYGLAAVEMVKDHPWFGVGIGRFDGQSQAYYRRVLGQRVPGDNAQNLWRQVLAEQGIAGFAPVLWLTLLTLRALMSPLRAAEDIVVRAAVVALGAALTVGYPVQAPGVALTLATLVAGVVGPSPSAASASS